MKFPQCFRYHDNIRYHYQQSYYYIVCYKTINNKRADAITTRKDDGLFQRYVISTAQVIDVEMVFHVNAVTTKMRSAPHTINYKPSSCFEKIWLFNV